MEKAFNLTAQENLDSEIDRMVYSRGLPFHLARNSYFVSAITYVANNIISGYIPTRYNILWTTLLQKERDNIKSN